MWRYIVLLVISSIVYGEEAPNPDGPPPQTEDMPDPSTAPPPENEQDGNLNQNNQNSNNNNTTNTSNRTYNGAGSSGMPVQSAIAPSLMSTGSETCLRSSSYALQAFVLGMSRGHYKLDEECNRRRDAKTLNDLGLKVSAVARMCKSTEIWESLFISGTPCPIMRNGRLIVGKRAYLEMKRNPEIHIPNYVEKEDWYNKILGIGGLDEAEANGNGNGDTLSLSERYRSSLRSSTE